MSATLEELRDLMGLQSPSETSKDISLLLFGFPGVGKTRLAGTAADSEHTSPVFWVDVEGGTKTIADKENIEVKLCRSVDDVVKCGNILEKNPGVFKCKVIDSLSELQRLDMALIMKKAHQANANQDPEVPSPREWGKSQLHIRDIVRFYRDLPGHSIFITHASEKDDENTGITHTRPSLPGKLANEIAGFVDIVGYMSAKTKTVADPATKKQRKVTVYSTTFQATNTITAKDRTDKLDSVMEFPTIPALWEAINS